MNKKVLLEIVWWIATIVIVILFLLPLITNIGDKYPYYIPNIFFIVLFITFTRYIFLLKHTFIADRRWVKAILVFLPIPLFFYALDSHFNFQDFVDKNEHIDMLSHLLPDKAMEISNYMKYQFIFFATGSFIVMVLLPIRMIVSVWREINRGTV